MSILPLPQGMREESGFGFGGICCSTSHGARVDLYAAPASRRRRVDNIKRAITMVTCDVCDAHEKSFVCEISHSLNAATKCSHTQNNSVCLAQEYLE